MQLQASFFSLLKRRLRRRNRGGSGGKRFPSLFMSVMIGDWVRNIAYLTGDGMENLLNEDILNVRELSNTSQIK